MSAMMDRLLELTGGASAEAGSGGSAPASVVPGASVAPVAPVAAATARADTAGADVATSPGTFMDLLSSYGLIPGFRRALGKLPFEIAGETFGKEVADETAGRELTAYLREEYADAGKLLSAERTENAKSIDGIQKMLSTNPAEAFKRFAVLTTAFSRARDDAYRIAGDPAALKERIKDPKLVQYNIKTRQDFLLRAQKFQNMIDAIGLQQRFPIVTTENELDQFLANCKPGVPCFFTRYENGDYKITEVVLPEQ